MVGYLLKIIGYQIFWMEANILKVLNTIFARTDEENYFGRIIITHETIYLKNKNVRIDK